jgi:hypothetical protein
VSHRLTPRDHGDGALFDVLFQLVHLVVGGNDKVGNRLSERDQRLDGLAELVFGKAAHLGDQLAQFAKLFVERLSRYDWTWISALSGLSPDQPKRPVM